MMRPVTADDVRQVQTLLDAFDAWEEAGSAWWGPFPRALVDVFALQKVALPSPADANVDERFGDGLLARALTHAHLVLDALWSEARDGLIPGAQIPAVIEARQKPCLRCRSRPCFRRTCDHCRLADLDPDQPRRRNR